MAHNISVSKASRNDPHYRYKMPVLLTKHEGRGNGVKTVLFNIVDVARSLERPPMYPTKFFGNELGAQTLYDEKSDRYILNGTHDTNKLRETLDSFIDKFVLCGACLNPETDLVITKDERIMRDCKACGERRPVDMGHKLVAYILRNPPKKPKKVRQNTSDSKGEGSDAENSADDEMSRKIADGAEAMAKVSIIDADQVDWSADTSKAAQAARIQALNAGIQGAVMGDDDDEESGPYADYKKWVADNKSTASDAELYKKAVDMGIDKKHRTVQALVEGLFDENVTAEVEKHAAVFLKLLADTEGDKHQKSLLGGIERLIGVSYPELVPQTPKVLMAFYQAEILDEEFVLNWGKHVSKKYVPKEVSKQVRLAAKPFCKWLEEQESSDEEEEEE